MLGPGEGLARTARTPACGWVRVLLVALLAFASGLACGQGPLVEIRTLQEAGRFEESIEPLRTRLAAKPDDGEANLLLGVALVQTGQPVLALAPLERARAASEHRIVAGLLLATTLLILESPEQAVEVSSDLLGADPGLNAARRLRAHALLAAKRPEAALADAEWLHEAATDDLPLGLLRARILAALGRAEEADGILAGIESSATASGGGPGFVRACLARAALLEDAGNDDARIEHQYVRCLAEAKGDPSALRALAGFYDKRGRGTEATAVWESAVEREPRNLLSRQALAVRYEAEGRGDAARELLQAGVDLAGGAPARLSLADFERRNGRPGAALAAVEQAEEAMPQPDERVRFLRGELLVELGRLEEAEQLAGAFEEPSLRELLRGRIQLARGDAGAALASFDAALRRLPNDAVGRYLTGLAARELGYVERAVAEFRESLRADPGASDAALALAVLEAERGRHQQAIDAARVFIGRRGHSRPDGYRVVATSQSALGMYEAARESVSQMRAAGFLREAAMENARIESAASGGGAEGAAAGAAALRASGLDLAQPANGPVLRHLSELLLVAGRGDEALAAVDEALARDAGQASLHELRGVVLLRMDRRDEARAAFEAALARDSANVAARSGLAALAYQRGDLERAIALYDEAAHLTAETVHPAYAAAQIVLARGDRADARQRLEEVVRRQPGHVGACNDLAWLLATQREDLDRALDLAELAYRRAPSPEITHTLGLVRLERGEIDLAVPLFEQALAGRPDSQVMRFHLGLALARSGERERAVETLRAALAPGPFPDAAAARAELARLEAP
jgi:tetratricopeptide (TPR) repeat protein